MNCWFCENLGTVCLSNYAICYLCTLVDEAQVKLFLIFLAHVWIDMKCTIISESPVYFCNQNVYRIGDGLSISRATVLSTTNDTFRRVDNLFLTDGFLDKSGEMLTYFWTLVVEEHAFSCWSHNSQVIFHTVQWYEDGTCAPLQKLTNLAVNGYIQRQSPPNRVNYLAIQNSWEIGDINTSRYRLLICPLVGRDTLNTRKFESKIDLDEGHGNNRMQHISWRIIGLLLMENSPHLNPFGGLKIFEIQSRW